MRLSKRNRFLAGLAAGELLLLVFLWGDAWLNILITGSVLAPFMWAMAYHRECFVFRPWARTGLLRAVGIGLAFVPLAVVVESVTLALAWRASEAATGQPLVTEEALGISPVSYTHLTLPTKRIV